MSSAFRNNTNSAGSTTSSPSTSKAIETNQTDILLNNENQNQNENISNPSGWPNIVNVNPPPCGWHISSTNSSPIQESSTTVSWTASPAPPKRAHMEVRIMLPKSLLIFIKICFLLACAQIIGQRPSSFNAM